jgi:hypothetical protein
VLNLRCFLFSVASVLCLSFSAHADILLEPYLGYGIGKIKMTTPSASESDVSGTAIGARVAYTIPMFFFGLDYSMLMGKLKRTSPSSADFDMTGSGLFAVAGVQIPLIRAWAGYGLMQDFVAKNASGESTTSGTAIKFGAGFTGLPFVSLNLEYLRGTYSKTKASGVEVSADGTGDIYLLSVSLPLDF